MTFGELINILGIYKSQSQSTRQVKITWIDEYFPWWEMKVVTDGGVGIVKRYRDEDGIFDGTVMLEDFTYYSVEDNMDKLPIIINKYNKFFATIFEDKYFQENFDNSILE